MNDSNIQDKTKFDKAYKFTFILDKISKPMHGIWIPPKQNIKTDMKCFFTSLELIDNEWWKYQIYECWNNEWSQKQIAVYKYWKKWWHLQISRKMIINMNWIYFQSLSNYRMLTAKWKFMLLFIYFCIYSKNVAIFSSLESPI